MEGKENKDEFIIYGRLNSVNVQKVVLAAHELGVPFRRIDAGGAFELNKLNPKYLGTCYFYSEIFNINVLLLMCVELNPNGLVPTIDDKGFILYESNSIVRYIAENYSKVALFHLSYSIH